MSLPKSLLSYRDCIDYFDTALRYSEGARVKVKDPDEGFNLRMRLNNCRKLDREANARIYPETHRMHGCSAYDAIVIKVQRSGDDFFVMLERTDISRRAVEGVGQHIEVLENDELVPLPAPQKALPAPAEMEELEVVEEPNEVPRMGRRL